MGDCNPPAKLHFIPAFYTSGWAQTSDLIAYRKIASKVIELPKHPNAVGFEKNYYPSVLEERFFKPIDNFAAEFLDRIKNNPIVKANGSQRSVWTRFLMSMMLRTPEDVAILKNYWPKLFFTTDEDAEKSYQEIRKTSDPETFRQFLESLPDDFVESSGFELWIDLIDHQEVGDIINKMYWEVLDLAGSRFSLLTSDRPVILSNSLRGRGAHLALPIGPDQLFIAASDPKFVQELKQKMATNIARTANTIVVSNAVEYVFAEDRSQAQFIRNRIGAKIVSRPLERSFLDSAEQTA